jgi:hypothetical protein
MPDIIITENGINKLLQNINIHKASGSDNIHGRILRVHYTNSTYFNYIIFEKNNMSLSDLFIMYFMMIVVHSYFIKQ